MSDTLSPSDVPVSRQRAFLLHQLATAENGELTQGKANAPAALKPVGLEKEEANHLREQLRTEGLLHSGKSGKSVLYRITDAGRDHLREVGGYTPPPPPPPKPPKKSPAELVADKVRAKVAELDHDAVVAEKALGKPAGKKVTEAQTQAFADTLAELLKAGALHAHPGGKYGKKPPLTLTEVVRKQVEATLANKAGPFTRSALSKPKTGASDDEKKNHQEALEQVIAELVEAKKLFPHSGGKYGQLRERTPADDIREEAAANLPGLSGSFRPEDLSQPKDGAKKGEKKAHADALATVVAELVENQSLFRHPGGRLSKEPYVDPHRELREVYTLHQFFRAPNHTITQADIELAFPGAGKPEKKQLEAKHPHVARFRGQGCFEMGAPTTRTTLAELVAAGDLRNSGEAEGGEYTLTDAGAKRLEQARVKFPVLPPVGDPATPDDAAMREKWEAFVLLRLTESVGFTGGETAVFAGGYPKGSKLNEATAWVLYGELAKAGHVTARWNGTEGEYTLTPKGLRHLAGLSFDGFPEVKLKGPALTALLAAARGGEKTTPTPTPTAPPPADLEAAVMDIFHRLLRERHTITGMVPIHEVRAEVRARYGDRAASHEMLDGVILNLWRAKRLRMSSLEDAGAATLAERQDSIPGVGETLFYLESPNDSAVV